VFNYRVVAWLGFLGDPPQLAAVQLWHSRGCLVLELCVLQRVLLLLLYCCHAILCVLRKLGAHAR
jgi:hypothetical protein